MLRAGSLQFPILASFLLFSSIFPLLSQGKERSPDEISRLVPFQAQHNSDEIYKDVNGVGLGEKRRVLAEGPNGELPLNSSSLILAAKRTYREDPLNDFKKYTGGWNISNRHYWASVGFTAVPFFLVALIWFAIFGLCLLFICICYCCCAREQYGYSRLAYALSLILLIVFNVAAIVGCIILYVGQGKFHSSTINTLGYVVHQANTTADSLRNVSGYLAAAKQISVVQFLLPGNVQSDIDGIMNKINSSASELATKTSENKDDIDNLIEAVRVALIVLSAIMLLLTFLGFVFSIFGMQCLVYILVAIGWILITGTFILCGIFLLLHNVTADSCVAMDQWVQNPMAHTALDDILPCVDNATAQETLRKSKEVTYQLCDVNNKVITTVSNNNFPPNSGPFYYNQSGPRLPILCNPFHADLTARPCDPGEVHLSNATKVWSKYVCQASSSDICITSGRLTPKIYSQMAAAVNVSFGLYHYGQFLTDLQNCDFVSDFQQNIHDLLSRSSTLQPVGLCRAGCGCCCSNALSHLLGRIRERKTPPNLHENQ